MRGLWVMAPVLGGAVAHAPVLRRDLLKPLKKPISRRLFGANKTWRGALMMTAGTTAATVALHKFPAYRRRLPREVAEADPRLVGLLLGLAVWTGELPNSFIKRRLGIPPGEQRRDAVGVAISVFDQADFVPTAWLLLSPVWRMSAAEAIRTFAAVAAAHMPINVIGYAIGARRSLL